MTFFTGLYHMLVGPLELLFEFIFFQVFRLLQNPGLTIIVLSLVMNFLVLPLYKRADEMQESQREMERKLNPWVTHLKKNFKGDERYMLLQTYYRQNHYKPVYALKGTVSLLLEIPFFIAAYNVLSNMNVLQGWAFGPIRDLGVPDAMFTVGSFSVNMLPVLMTVINLITSMLYTRGLPLRSKIQLYGMALIFLVLLYDSPSGLVFYWTLNNVFSLAKTIFYKLKNPRKTLNILSSVLGILMLLSAIFYPVAFLKRKLLMGAAAVVLQLPILLSCGAKRKNSRHSIEITREDDLIFFAGCVLLTVLTGLVIPSSLISASPEEFIDLHTFTSPIAYLVSGLLVSVGAFLIWFTIFYKLASPLGKKVMEYGVCAAGVAGFIDFLFFGTNLGTLSPELKYVNAPVFPVSVMMLNLGVLLLAATVVFLLWKYRKNFFKYSFLVLCLSGVLLSVPGIYKIQKTVNDRIDAIQSSVAEPVHVTLSRNGKNVVVMMMDRAINDYIPYLMNEKPELQDQFAGFTYYPNTISYGPYTRFGVPGVYGGYEYIPEEMNRRNEEKMVDKHNESLKVMPVSFLNAGFHVTVCDPSFAGYRWFPDLSIYEEYPEIHAYITQRADPMDQEDLFWDDINHTSTLYRNLFWFSLFKSSPVILQPYIYANSTYNDLNVLYRIANAEEKGQAPAGREQICSGPSYAVGYSAKYQKCWGGLKRFLGSVEIRNTDKNCFVMMSNETTHEPILLQEPDYVISDTVDNRAYDEAHGDRFILDGRKLIMENEEQMIHYHANMASMLEIGKWLDQLRAEGIYDNTRIIIVSDHGAELKQLEDMLHPDEKLQDLMRFHPLLMIKDFNSTEFTTDTDFMTNADVPSLAMEGLILNPVNPFTGKPINMDHKQEPEQHVFDSRNADVYPDDSTTFGKGVWHRVRSSDPLNPASWERIPQ